MAIQFTKGGMSDLTLEHGRLFPVEQPIEVNQENYLTESLNAKVIDFGGSITIYKLRFNNLTRDNYDGTVNGLKTWFENSNINWMMNTFSLIDENGVTHTVQLWQKEFNMRMLPNSRYEIELILKVIS